MIDFLIPTQEEMQKTIKHICETCEISLSDRLVLMKMKLIHNIVKSRKEMKQKRSDNYV